MTIDVNSATWHAVRAHAETAIEKAREALTVSGLSMAETESERGAVKALRAVLALDPTTPKVEFKQQPDGFSVDL